MGVVGVGIDAVEVERFRRVLARTPSLAARLFTDDERAVAGRRRDDTPALAARFAAKEAVLKSMAVGVGACRWHDIEVVRAESGSPSVTLRGAARRLADDLGIGHWHVSLTHTGSIAGAMAVASR